MTLAVLVFFAWAWRFIQSLSFMGVDGKKYYCLFDDAFISMRYAWNLSHGNGLVWNVGEYVEGYTNFLMTLCMAIATWIADRRLAVLIVQLCCAAQIALAAWATGLVAKRLADGPLKPLAPTLQCLAFVAALACPPLVKWSMYGMECALVACFLMFATLFTIRHVQAERSRDAYLAAVLFGLAYLTRPDSLIPALPALALLPGRHVFSRRERPRLLRAVGAGLVFLAFPLGHTLFRKLYYGALAPNTYLLKVAGIPLSIRIENGWLLVNDYFAHTWLLWLGAVLSLLLDFSRIRLALASMALLFLGYMIYVGGDAFGYSRLTAPTLLLVIILFVDGVCRLTLFSMAGAARWLPVSLSAALLLLSVWAGFSGEVRILTGQELPLEFMWNKRWTNVSIVLNRILKPEATIGVFWAGAIPYYTPFKAIDHLGKSNRRIASLAPDLTGGMRNYPGHNKYDLSYSILELKPTYTQFLSWGHDETEALSRRQYHSIRFHGNEDLNLLRGSDSVRWNLVQR